MKFDFNSPARLFPGPGSRKAAEIMLLVAAIGGSSAAMAPKMASDIPQQHGGVQASRSSLPHDTVEAGENGLAGRRTNRDGSVQVFREGRVVMAQRPGGPKMYFDHGNLVGMGDGQGRFLKVSQGNMTRAEEPADEAEPTRAPGR